MGTLFLSEPKNYRVVRRQGSADKSFRQMMDRTAGRVVAGTADKTPAFVLIHRAIEDARVFNY